MKKYSLVLLLLILSSFFGEGILWAQFEEFNLTSPYLLCPAFSAPVVGDTLWANVDGIPDTLFDTLGNVVGFDSITSVKLFYSINNQSTWDSVSLSCIGQQFYENTYEVYGIYPGSGTDYFYFRAIDDSGKNFAMESPKNTTNAFPAPENFLARACIESPNDIVPGAPGNFLELTNFQITYSDNKIYGTLSNATGNWPWDEGGIVPLEWYGYGFAIVNPPKFKHDSDTVYIAIRVDLPSFIGYLDTPGLYKIYEDASGQTQIVFIADIEYTTSGGKLHIRFNLLDLINDPSFGEYTGELGVAAATAWADLDGGHFADGTQPTRWYQRIHILTPGANTAPYLVNPMVDPIQGDTTTTFTFSVTYVDNENNLPVIKKLYIDPPFLPPFNLGTPDHSYQDSSLFTMALGPFTPGWHKFYFEFSDGQYTVVSPIDSFRVLVPFVAEYNQKGFSNDFTSTIVRPGYSIGLPEGIEVHLFNALGQEICSPCKGRTFTFPNLSPGVYFLRVGYSENWVVRKVIVVR